MTKPEILSRLEEIVTKHKEAWSRRDRHFMLNGKEIETNNAPFVVFGLVRQYFEVHK